MTLKVAGVCFDPHFKVYILWTLKLMKDVSSIFPDVEYLDLTAGQHETSKKKVILSQYDVIISDKEILDLQGLKKDVIVAYLRSK